MPKLSNTPVVVRLFLLITAALLAITALTTTFLCSERDLVMQERQSSVKNNVEIALGVVSHYETLSREGRISVDDAQRQALEAVRELRYGNKDYFWVQNQQGVMLMHPFSPKLNGTNMSDYQDPSGKRFFAEMLDKVARSGQGFVEYQWPKPGRDQPQPKISYVKGLPTWGWIVGSGVYVDNVNEATWQRVLVFGGVALVIFIVLLALGLLIARSILRQLGGEPGYASDVTRRIAVGDLTSHIEAKYPGEDNLLNSISTMRDQLAGMVNRVRSNAEAVASASEQITQGNHDLSSRTESHASSLEQTAAAMEEFGATVKQNADSARQANELAQSASAVAEAGGQVVSQVVDTMREITASSQKIAEIIGVIDGIAFQTNILALNAAVEAARAGEQGRGFAVVAGEVRTLAQRSAAAAKEIKDLIHASVLSVDQGSALVGKAGATMNEVVASIRHVTDIVGSISLATDEQNSGLHQVSEAVRHMDSATQQNAALVEEMASATSNLNDLAQELLQTVAAFKLDRRG